MRGGEAFDQMNENGGRKGTVHNNGRAGNENRTISKQLPFSFSSEELSVHIRESSCTGSREAELYNDR